MKRMLRTLLRGGVLLALVFSAPSCSNAPEAVVEEMLASGPAPVPLQLASIEGGRDGARTSAEVVFGGTGSELRLSLVLEYDPQPVLHEGQWEYRGPTGTGSGTVRAESVRFVGGQGEGASIGGVYRLEDETGALRFRVRLPLTPIRQDWRPGP